MPSGIILSSGSQGATQEAIEKVLTDHGYEADKPEVTVTEPAEPKREDFETDEAFEAAQEEFAAKAEEAAEEEEERKEKERLAKLPKTSRRQRAVEKATKELREENKKLAERLAALEGKKPETAQPKIQAPKREDFATDAEYEEAMFDYRYKVRRAKEDADAAQNAQQTRLKENFENYQTAVETFKDEHDDWDEVVNQQLPIHESVYLAIIEQENGPQVTYYLGKHPDFARRLAEMTPLSAVMEVGRLADRLKGGQKPEAGEKPKPKPRLPEPVKPVSTAATSSSLTSAEAAKSRDFRAFKAAQRAGR
jgi:hypothetical protein